MISELPKPQSIWCQRSTMRLMRVIYSEAHDIIAHDAELADRRSAITSWRGTAEEFFASFMTAEPKLYPKTAS